MEIIDRATMDAYARVAVDATRTRDARALTSCVDAFASDSACARAVDLVARDADADAAPRALRARGARTPWDDACGGFVRARALMGEARTMAEAYEAHALGTKALVKAFRGDDEGGWMTEAVTRAADDARRVAVMADEALRARGERPSKLADCGSTLMLVYRAVSQTSNPEKKTPQLRVVNGLFKVYFSLNALHLCKNLINAVNLPTFLPFESFTKAERVTYNFYVGRLAVFEDSYERAATHLEYAFAHCHAKSAKNVRLILQYLIPVKMILGTLPSKELLQKYDLREFADVTEAMRRGDARLLNSALGSNESTFIKQGTYLLLEKLRMSVYRTLFKKIHAIQGEMDPAKANQVALAKFQTALHWCGADDVDLDEVECIVANLIFRKFVKGYISHKNRVVVLSKMDPFPSLKSIFAE